MKRPGTKGYARAHRAALAGEPPPPDREDDDEQDDGEEQDDDRAGAMADHEPLRAEAEAACMRAAEAYKASAGSDSAGLLLAAEDAGDEAMEAHTKAKASSAKLRGAPAAEAPPPRPGAPPPAPAPPGATARAVVAVAGSDAAAQLQLTRDARLGALARQLFGGADHDATEGAMRAALQDATEAKGLRVAAEKAAREKRKRDTRDASAALRAELSAAVRAGKYSRAEVFDVSEGRDAEGNAVEVLTPQAWIRDMTPGARAAMIAKKQARAGVGAELLPDDTATPITAAVRDYCVRRGITDEKRIAAIAAQMSGGTPAAQESA